jgi:hypothetical protein
VWIPRTPMDAGELLRPAAARRPRR